MKWILLGFVAVSCVGCQTDHLVFTTYTKAGLDISATDAQPTQLMLGYKRYEGAIVPVELPKVEDAEEGEAMSVYAAMELNNEWFGGLEIMQIFATGKAAVNAAEKPDAFADLVRGMRDEGEEE
jgi:hypothetical protein